MSVACKLQLQLATHLILGAERMATQQEQQSRQVAEDAREAEWRGSSFLREAFLGRMRPELIPDDAFDTTLRPGVRRRIYAQLEAFLRDASRPRRDRRDR